MNLAYSINFLLKVSSCHHHHKSVGKQEDEETVIKVSENDKQIIFFCFQGTILTIVSRFIIFVVF